MTNVITTASLITNSLFNSLDPLDLVRSCLLFGDYLAWTMMPFVPVYGPAIVLSILNRQFPSWFQKAFGFCLGVHSGLLMAAMPIPTAIAVIGFSVFVALPFFLGMVVSDAQWRQLTNELRQLRVNARR